MSPELLANPPRAIPLPRSPAVTAQVRVVASLIDHETFPTKIEASSGFSNHESHPIAQPAIGQLSNIYASPVGASGRIYISGRNGKTLVLDRSSQFKVLATNELNERFDASPALAGSQLFLRGAEYLYFIETN